MKKFVFENDAALFLDFVFVRNLFCVAFHFFRRRFSIVLSITAVGVAVTKLQEVW